MVLEKKKRTDVSDGYWILVRCSAMTRNNSPFCLPYE